MIITPPMDVIIGLEQEKKRLTGTASFKCVALGRPAPDINWYYIVVNRDGSLGEPERLMNNERYRIVNNDGDEDPTGRFNSTSTLGMSVTESDGGIIRCQAGTTFADAHLTVLSKFQQAASLSYFAKKVSMMWVELMTTLNGHVDDGPVLGGGEVGWDAKWY